MPDERYGEMFGELQVADVFQLDEWDVQCTQPATQTVEQHYAA